MGALPGEPAPGAVGEGAERCGEWGWGGGHRGRGPVWGSGLKAAPGRALRWAGPQGCPGLAVPELQWAFPPESLFPHPLQFVPRWSEEGAAARPGGARVPWEGTELACSLSS